MARIATEERRIYYVKATTRGADPGRRGTPRQAVAYITAAGGPSLEHAPADPGAASPHPAEIERRVAIAPTPAPLLTTTSTTRAFVDVQVAKVRWAFAISVGFLTRGLEERKRMADAMLRAARAHLVYARERRLAVVGRRLRRWFWAIRVAMPRDVQRLEIAIERCDRLARSQEVQRLYRAAVREAPDHGRDPRNKPPDEALGGVLFGLDLLVFCRDDAADPESAARHRQVSVQAGGSSSAPVARHAPLLRVQLAMAGVPLRQVQVWLGHSSIVTTQRYVHLAPGGGRELIGALDRPAARANQVQTDRATNHQPATT